MVPSLRSEQDRARTAKALPASLQNASRPATASMPISWTGNWPLLTHDRWSAEGKAEAKTTAKLALLARVQNGTYKLMNDAELSWGASAAGRSRRLSDDPGAARALQMQVLADTRAAIMADKVDRVYRLVGH